MIAMFIDDVGIVALAALGAAILRSVYVELFFSVVFFLFVQTRHLVIQMK